MAALVEAATRLFAASGPDGVALRAVADEARVNYGLIHQYVGSKDDLLQLVLRTVSERSARLFEEAEGLDGAIDQLFGNEVPGFVPMLAWALLQGRDARELLGRSPALQALADRTSDRTAEREGDREDERAARLAAVVSMALGWHLFGGFVAAGVGRSDPDGLTPDLKKLATSILAELEDPARET